MQYEILSFLEGVADAAAEKVRGWRDVKLDPAKLAKIKNILLMQFTMPAVHAQLAGMKTKDGLTPNDWLEKGLKHLQGLDDKGRIAAHTMILINPRELNDAELLTKKILTNLPYDIIPLLFHTALNPPICINPVSADIAALLAIRDRHAQEKLNDAEKEVLRATFRASPLDVNSFLRDLEGENEAGEKKPGQYL